MLVASVLNHKGFTKMLPKHILRDLDSRHLQLGDKYVFEALKMLNVDYRKIIYFTSKIPNTCDLNNLTDFQLHCVPNYYIVTGNLLAWRDLILKSDLDLEEEKLAILYYWKEAFNEN